MRWSILFLTVAVALCGCRDDNVIVPLAAIADVSHGCLASPLGKREIKVTFPFGGKMRRPGALPHRGVDLRAAAGTKVTACDSGRIVVAGLSKTGVGWVEIDIGNGWRCGYAHLRRWSVSVGDVVNRGATLGESGGARGVFGSGPVSTGPHLHFTLTRDGVPINPVPYLCRRPARR